MESEKMFLHTSKSKKSKKNNVHELKRSIKETLWSNLSNLNPSQDDSDETKKVKEILDYTFMQGGSSSALIILGNHSILLDSGKK